MSPGPKSFSLKSGNCYLYPDRVEIQRTDLQGRISAWLSKKGLHAASLYYLAFFVGLLIAALLSQLIQNYFLSFFFGASALASLYGLWVNRRVSYASIIPRDQIESVEYQPAVQGVSRARFAIDFRPKKRLYQRIIPLPSATHQGTSLADTAFWMMREAGLIKSS